MLNDLGYGDYVQAMLLGKYKDRPGMDKWNKDNDSFEDPVAEHCQDHPTLHHFAKGEYPRCSILQRCIVLGNSN